MHAFIFNKCPIYTHDVASAKFRTNSKETDNSAPRLPLPSRILDSYWKTPWTVSPLLGYFLYVLPLLVHVYL
jgi:hypothetical protein